MSIYEFEIKSINGDIIKMSKYRGKVVLIVNTATGCGFTPQYEGLQMLYEKYHSKGFEILDFPCNQFGSQAGGSEEEILSFCQSNYGITFPQFAKIEVNGNNESPLYTYLKKQKGGLLGNKIKWNFTKFLVDKNGTVVERFSPNTIPHKIESRIKSLLQ